jgi:hypothetical protein
MSMQIQTAGNSPIDKLREIWYYTYKYGMLTPWNLNGICPKKKRTFKNTGSPLRKPWKHFPIRMDFS